MLTGGDWGSKPKTMQEERDLSIRRSSYFDDRNYMCVGYMSQSAPRQPLFKRLANGLLSLFIR